MRRVVGLVASVLIVGAVIVACRPSGDIGYVEIKTVPVAATTQAALYLDSEKLAPIKTAAPSCASASAPSSSRPATSPARKHRCATSSSSATASRR